jgi:hypothetical protein
MKNEQEEETSSDGSTLLSFNPNCSFACALNGIHVTQTNSLRYKLGHYPSDGKRQLEFSLAPRLWPGEY